MIGSDDIAAGGTVALCIFSLFAAGAHPWLPVAINCIGLALLVHEGA